MPKKIDLKNQRFGKLVVLQESSIQDRIGGRITWLCQCDCGKQKLVQAQRLRNGTATHCGCENIVDITGQRFGKLVALRPTEERKHGGVVWECQCDCGNIVKATKEHLRVGDAKSCGCLRNEIKPEKANRLVGERFGKLVVQKPSTQRNKHGGLLWECLCDCGNVCLVSTNHLHMNNTQSCGCLMGNSVGEINIRKILEQNQIKYKQEYIFPDYPWYRYDFAIFNQNGKVVQLIEFDGEQHFIENSFFPRSLEEQQQIDASKNKIAKDKQIKLVRIPYTKRDKITFEDLEIDIYESFDNNE